MGRAMGELSPERPAAESRSLKGRPGAAKPQVKKKQAVRLRAHGAVCTQTGTEPQDYCVKSTPEADARNNLPLGAQAFSIASAFQTAGRAIILTMCSLIFGNCEGSTPSSSSQLAMVNR